jgi:hypothetical protein
MGTRGRQGRLLENPYTGPTASRPVDEEATMSRYDWEQESNLFRRKKPMRILLSAALTATTASVMLAGTSIATAATPSQNDRAVITSTAPVSGSGKLSTLAASTRLQLSVFVGQDQAGLAAAATAVSDPASPSYRHYLSPAQVRARYGQIPATGYRPAAGLWPDDDLGAVRLHPDPTA